MKLLNWVTWFMFGVSLVISVASIIVAYGIRYIPQFATLLPLEVSLIITFFLWGFSSLFEGSMKDRIRSLIVSLLIGGVLMIFAFWGIY